MSISKIAKRIRRHGRIRSKIQGTATRPRLSVFRSNKYLYAQLIDDETGTTLAAANSQGSNAKTADEKATEVGKAIADAAKTKNISEVVFDRGGFLYAGKIQKLADAAREAGLKF